MKKTTELLSRTFLDYEALGAHQAIAAMYLFDRAPDPDLLRERVALIPQTFPELSGAVTLQLETLPEEPLGSFASRAISTGLQFPDEKLRFVCSSVKGGYAVAGLIHHSVADGLGGMETMKRLFLDAGPRDLRGEADSRSGFDAEERELFSFRAALSIAARYILPNRYIHSARASGENLSQARKRELAFLTLPKHSVRDLRNVTQATLNELFLFGVRGVVRHLHPSGSSTGALFSTKGRPTDNEKNVLLPVNLRPRQLKLALGNYLLAIPIPLALDEQPVALALEQLRLTTGALIGAQSIRNWRSARMLVCKLPRLLRRAALKRIAGNLLCIATYVPQKSPPRKIGDALLIAQFGVPALLPGQELGFALMSYQDLFGVTVVTAGELLGRGPELIRVFGEELEKLSAAFPVREPRAAAAKS